MLHLGMTMRGTFLVLALAGAALGGACRKPRMEDAPVTIAPPSPVDGSAPAAKAAAAATVETATFALG